MKTKLLPIGTKVRTIRDVYFPFSGKIHKTGEIGTITAAGIDAQFGWYTVTIDGDSMMLEIRHNFEIVS